MTLESRDKKTLSELRMQKALEFLDDAKKNYDDKRYRTSVNRSYYAALNAVRSLLILEGANPETHDGAITLLSLRFVKTGMLSSELVKKFKLLLSRRTDVDYGDFDAIDEDEALESYKDACSVIESIDAVRKTMMQ